VYNESTPQNKEIKMLTEIQSNQFLNTVIEMMRDLEINNGGSYYVRVIANDDFICEAIDNTTVPELDTLSYEDNRVLIAELWELISTGYEILMSESWFQKQY
jgi:hypothetical protein